MTNYCSFTESQNPRFLHFISYQFVPYKSRRLSSGFVGVCLALILSLFLQRTALFLGGFSVIGQYFACFAAGVGHVLPHTQTCRWTEREVRVDEVCTDGLPESS